MKQKMQRTAVRAIRRFRSFRYSLIVEGVLVGAAAGLAIVLFRLALDRADEVRAAALAFCRIHGWAVALLFPALILAALAVALLLRWEPLISGSGIPQVEGEMQGHLSQKWWRVLTAKFTGGVLAIGCGLSLGREGPSIQLGAMVGKGVARIAGRMKTEEKLLLSCGASAGLAAAFNAPLAGVLFALEEVHRNITPEVLLSTMASSITADFISRQVFGLRPVFSFSPQNLIPLGNYGHVIILGIALGFVGVLYNTTLIRTQDLFRKIPMQFVRLLIPFLLAGVFGLVYPAVLGGGHALTETLVAGTLSLGALFLLFAVKFGFSMLSFGSGSPGGIFLPLLILGAIVGGAYAGAAGLDSQLLENFIILGMAGAFSAIVRAPVTGIILISEMTGGFSHLLTLAIVSLFAYLVPDLLRCRPVYDLLLHRMPGHPEPESTGEKVLVDSVIRHGSAAEGKCVRDVTWPKGCLLVSVLRGEEELVPLGDTTLYAGDRVTLLCDEAQAVDAHRMLQRYFEQVRAPVRRS